MQVTLQDELSRLLYLGKVSAMQKCPMMYYWSHHLHLQQAQKPDYLSFGSGFHRAALELGLVYGFPVAEAVLSQRIDLAEALGWKKNMKVLEELGRFSEADRTLMLNMLDVFSAKIKECGIKQILGVEKTVLNDVRHLSKHFDDWCIKIDFLFEDGEGIWAGDLKTTSSYGASTAKYYHSSPQTKTYFYWAQQKMPNLRGTKIFVVTKKAVRCEVETIHLTDRDKYEAELFVGEAIKQIDNIEETKQYSRCMTSCINFMGQECPFIPLCIKPITSQQYLDDLLHNWYKIEDPDDHLELP